MRLWTVLLCAFCLACGEAKTSTAQATPTPKVEQEDPYVCPMHAEITATEPDTCSKCGMDLVKREDLQKEKGHH